MVKLTKEHGSTRRLFAPLLRDAGHAVSDADLNLIDNRRRGRTRSVRWGLTIMGLPPYRLLPSSTHRILGEPTYDVPRRRQDGLTAEPARWSRPKSEARLVVGPAAPHSGERRRLICLDFGLVKTLMVRAALLEHVLSVAAARSGAWGWAVAWFKAGLHAPAV